jgi:hypothetical protein
MPIPSGGAWDASASDPTASINWRSRRTNWTPLRIFEHAMASDSRILNPRDIPILTDSIEQSRAQAPDFDQEAVHAAILTETLRLADSLLRQAARDIEATLFERVFDRLRSELPELVDRALRERAQLPEKNPETRG